MAASTNEMGLRLATERREASGRAGRVQDGHIPDALSHELSPMTGIDPPTPNGQPDQPRLLNDLQQVANQTPLIANQLTSTTRHWAAEGPLRAYATDLPHMDDMPEDRVRQVVAGHRVMASGADLAPLTAALNRAGSLSTALADELNRTATASPPAQLHLAAAYAARLNGPEAATGLTRDAHDVEQALAAVRAPFHTAPTHRPPAPSPGR